MDVTATSVAEVHQILSRRAAEIACADPRLKDMVEYPIGVWREASIKSATLGHGLCIDYDEALLDGRDGWWIEGMRQIGEDAIFQALLENGDLFVGLMVGEAREGRDYFSRFD